MQGIPTGGGLAIIVSGLRASCDGDADMIIGYGFAPDPALQTGIRTIGTSVWIATGGGLAIIIGGLRASVHGDTDLIICHSFTPDPALQAGVGTVVA